MNNLPKTWEEVNLSEDSILIETEFNKNYDKAFSALEKLIILRDIYRQGWKPDLRDHKEKYIITKVRGDLNKGILYSINSVISFQTSELRDQFFENFKELIEQAKELI